jgi:hypothetical protein
MAKRSKFVIRDAANNIAANLNRLYHKATRREDLRNSHPAKCHDLKSEIKANQGAGVTSISCHAILSGA